ncbi:hypothetical protein M8C21_015434 [Ambrosia artemisiifolia]|uniref:Remorin C-terminal domain-containing protein n=1 Tax=Ambrosia artemisiifolia TaxID=4212 RepID=A0AAD5GAI9_AMBAR|nr:hypothetical protein M8C21_015434 [Ambrosia artemisiifolia]
MGKQDGAPGTQGRPGFSFIVGSRKNFPSKWDDAEKWLINGHDSPTNFMLKQCGVNGSVVKHEETHKETEGVVLDEVQNVSLDHSHGSSDRGFSWASASDSSDVVLKDKFTNEVEPIFSKLKCLGTMEGVQGVKNKDTGTEMTPVESSTTTRCPTPLKSLSPPRHNTPESRYQIKEAKIQAWVNLQKAKAEAESKKLEVKIQKMRSKHEEKLMKKMTIVRRKAEELRAAAQLDHSEMVSKSNKPKEPHRPSVQFSGHQGSCGCLISN